MVDLRLLVKVYQCKIVNEYTSTLFDGSCNVCGWREVEISK